MKVKRYLGTEEWLADRACRITGSKLKDIVSKRKSKKRKIGVYKLVADRLAVQDGSIDGRDRGYELEQEAIDALSKETGIDFKTELVMFVSDDDPNMAYSPDGYTEDYKIIAEAKCLGSARHIQIIEEEEIPSDHFEQMIQSFVVNDKQETHYFISYDPRIISKPTKVIVTERADVEDHVEFYRDYQEAVLDDVEEIVERLAW